MNRNDMTAGGDLTCVGDRFIVSCISLFGYHTCRRFRWTVSLSNFSDCKLVKCMTPIFVRCEKSFEVLGSGIISSYYISKDECCSFFSHASSPALGTSMLCAVPTSVQHKQSPRQLTQKVSFSGFTLL